MLTNVNIRFPLFWTIFICFISANAQKKSVKIETGNWEKVVPSVNLPDSLMIMDGNNNLDLVKFKNRYFLAFRTAPSHFASVKTMIYILSSENAEKWQFEKSFQVGADMREPRFCAKNDTLFFYFFEGGKKALKFEPMKVWACHFTENEGWSGKKDLGMDHFVPWRIRRFGDKMYMSAYFGQDLYNSKHSAEQRLFVSSNGYYWTPVSEAPQVGGQGAEEAEFVFDDEGNIWGNIRIEGGGSAVFYAEKNNISNWQMYPSRLKYDSALMFRYKSMIFLVARRNLDGLAEKNNKLPSKPGRYYNMVRYSLTRKVTALWILDQNKKNWVHLMDFPSTGDTAFPGIAEIEEGKFILMNYSNDIDGPKKNWIRGQLGKTYIYKTELKITGL